MAGRSAAARPRADNVADYLSHADELFYDFLGQIYSIREMAQVIDRHGVVPLTQEDVDEEIAAAIEQSGRRKASVHATEDSGEAVRRDAAFQRVLVSTQQEVGRRIERLEESSRPDSKNRELREKTLAAGPDELAEMFGSLTNAWDTLVGIKLRTWHADELHRAIDAWLVTLVSECERFFRDFVTLALSTLGGDLADMLDKLFSEEGLGIGTPRPSELVGHRHPLDAIVSVVGRFSELGSSQTLAVAETVAAALDFKVFPERGVDSQWSGPHPEADEATCPGIDPGFVTDLTWICPKGEEPSARALWESLVVLRRRTIHGPADLKRGKRLDHAIYGMGSEEWKSITDFVGALGLRFGAMITIEVTRRQAQAPRHKKRADPEDLRRKLGAEFRLITKVLLEPESPRYALAWTLCELAMTLEGGRDKAPMLAMNAFFARQKLSSGRGRKTFVEKPEIRDYDVEGKAKRYELLQRSLLGEFKGIDKLLDELVKVERNMAPIEVEEWPALEGLRASSQYKAWRRKQPRLVRDQKKDERGAGR